MWTKNDKREIEIWFKQKTRHRMNYEWTGNSFKNLIQKIEKKVKNNVTD